MNYSTKLKVIIQLFDNYTENQIFIFNDTANTLQ